MEPPEKSSTLDSDDCVEKALEKTNPRFRDKVLKITTTSFYMDKLMLEKSVEDEYSIYPNRWIQVWDALILALGYFIENKNPEYDAEKALYEQIEPIIDEILAKKSIKRD